MIIEVDQSGKVEFTAKPTVVAFSNGKSSVVFIAARDKRELQKHFREAGRPRLYVYRVFALLVYLLIEPHLAQLDAIVIDTEYPGQESLIKQYLLTEIRKRRSFSARDVVFKPIGKRSAAHDLAWKTYRKKHRPDVIAKAADIRRLLLG